MRSSGVVVFCVTWIAACGGPSGPGDTSSLKIVASPQRSDTVLAAPEQALVVELRSHTRKVVPEQEIRFEALHPKGIERFDEEAILVCRWVARTCAGTNSLGLTFVIDTTDIEGRANVLVRYGTIAGPVWIRFSAPRYGLSDSVLFTVQPGAATQVRFPSSELALKVGSRATLPARVLDRWNNVRIEQPSYVAAFPNASIDSRGQVTGLSVGRAKLYANLREYRDSIFVSIVPNGRYLFHTIEGGIARVMEMTFDGSESRVVAENAMFPRIAPNGAIVVHHFTFGGGGQRVHLITPDSQQHRVTRTDMLQREEFGQLAPNGWIYFSGFTGGSFSIWRVRPDGTGLERRTHDLGEWRSSPSPDGTQLLYHRTGIYRNAFDAWDLIVMDIDGGFPRLEIRDVLGAAWSPDGSKIAYLTHPSRELMVVNADGSGRRRIPVDAGTYNHVDWTADAEFLLLGRSPRVELVRISDGERIPLPFSYGSLNAPVVVR
ncbi:MAG TPA: hypothetical protein VJ717_02815 [Gemmatimonadaceae bacterium]|nr:hypothetical protein [Gemmatimonadaceae bacterium]